MPAQSGLGFSGIVAINIPDGGAPGQVLTKVTADNYDYDWQAGGGGGAPTDAEYVVLSLDATLTDERVLTAGTGINIVDGGAGGNVTISFDSATAGYTLQDAYDANTTAPHITPTLADDLVIAGLMQIDDALTVGNANCLVFSDTYTQAAGFVGGCILSNGTITYANTTWIWALLQESKAYIANVGPGFAAFTLFNALASITNGLNASLVQALILNNGVSHRSTGAVAVTTTQTIGLSNAPNTRALAAFGSMTKTTGDTAVRHAPTFGTVNLSSIDFGTQRGLWMVNPTFGLFQPSAGVESMTAYIGVEMDAIPFGGNVTKRTIRSALTAATNSLMIENTGGAASDFGAGGLHFNDSSPVQFGGVGFNNQDVSIFWNPTGTLDIFFASFSDSLELSSPAANRFLIDSNAADNELNLNFERMSFGSAGAVGNQAFTFEQNARTVTVAGGYVSVNFTASGNLNLGVLAMSDVGAWNVNSLAFDNTAYSITDLYTFNVGGMTTSNPGGTVTRRHALRVTGRHTQRGTTSYETISPAALAAGDNDDWAGLLTGSPNNNTREWARVTGNATTSIITGIDSSAVQNDQYTITNVGTETILLANEDTGSLAANRIITPDGNNYVLSENRSAQLRYDDTTARWRIISPPAAVATLGGEWQFDNNTTMADPGNGNFRNNNATIGSVTAIAIADETKPGNDAGNILAAVASGDQLYLQNLEDASEFLVFDVTSNTDNTGWHQIGGTVNASGGNFTDGKEFLITVFFA